VADSHSSWAPRGPGRILSATRWSMQGLRHAFAPKFRFARVLLVSGFRAAGLWLGHSGVRARDLFGPLLPVLAAELDHSALELLVNHLWPVTTSWPVAPRLGSAAVFVVHENMLVCRR